MAKPFSRLFYHRLNRLIDEIKLIKELRHPGEKGKESEAVLREFLRTTLPEKWGIDTGFSITRDEVSSQIDIMIYDKGNYPVIYSGYAFKILPILAIFMAIEVKMILNHTNLSNAASKAETIRNQFISTQDFQFNGANEPNRIIKNCLFAFESDIKIDSIGEYLIINKMFGFDLIFVLNQGILFKDKNGYGKVTHDSIQWVGESVDGFQISKSHKLFLIFLTHLFEKAELHTRTKIDYLSWHMRDSVFDDTKEDLEQRHLAALLQPTSIEEGLLKFKGISLILMHCFFNMDNTITHYTHEINEEIYNSLPNTYSVLISDSRLKERNIRAGFIIKTNKTDKDSDFIDSLTGVCGVSPDLLDLINNPKISFLPAKLSFQGNAPLAEREMLKAIVDQYLGYGQTHGTA